MAIRRSAKWCQQLHHAVRMCSPMPRVKGSEDVTSTAGFAAARFVKTNLYFPQECRAGTKGDVLGLRFTQPTSPLMEDDPYLLELLPDPLAMSGRIGTSPLVACPWVTGFRLQEGWTSPAATSR